MKFLVFVALTMFSTAVCIGGVCNPDEETQTVGDYRWHYRNESGSAHIVGVEPTLSGDVVFPARLGGVPVSRFSSAVWNGGESVLSVPEGLLSIGERAFSWHDTLAGVEIPASVVSIGAEAFYGVAGPFYFRGDKPEASEGEDWLDASFDDVTAPMAYVREGTRGWKMGESWCGLTVRPMPNPGTVETVVSSVRAGQTMVVTFRRVGGSDGRIAVKVKTQTSTALMGTEGSADFDYVKEILTWGPGDTSERYIDIPTYATDWQGEPKMLRVKLATLATGAYQGNLVPTLAESKIYATIENAYDFGTVALTGPDPLAVVAGETARLVFSRLSGCDGAIAVKFKVQTSTAVAGVDFDYLKGVLVWEDGEFGDQVVEVPTYDAGKTDPNLMFRVKLSTLTQGAYEGCVTPKLESAKVYVPIVTAYNFGEFHGSVSTLVVPSIDIPVLDPSIFTDWPLFPEVPGLDTTTEEGIIEEWLSHQDDIPESDYYGADE